VGDAVAVVAQTQPVHGRRREFRCVQVEGAHPLRRARTAAELIKAARRIDARIAMRNAGHLGHALEALMGMLVIAQQNPRRTEKYLVHIVGGNSGGNAVDICCCQFDAPSVVLQLRHLNLQRPAVARERHIQLVLALNQIYNAFSIDNTSVAIGSGLKRPSVSH
jgi:hypothetical protein